MITARGLGRQFRRKGRHSAAFDAVKAVDITVEAGELVGFLGPNGAGKTTTLRMLTTLLTPTSGHATVAGCDLVENPRGVRQRIGYVAQGAGTSPESRVAEEVEMQGRLYGLSKAAARTRGAELMERFALTGLERRLSHTLSGGQRRRLDIVLGLIHSPGLVFLDEPTSGLDPHSRSDLWDHIRRLRVENGMTMFLTTHYLEEVDALCDRVLVMDAGRIIAEGTPDALKARISGDGIVMDMDPRHAAEAVAIVRRVTGAKDITTSTGRVRCRVAQANTLLPDLLRSLDSADITVQSLQVNRPSLDDVFLTLTGRTLRDLPDGHMPEALEETGSHSVA
ncbi:ATP-binding cassette domain-containing protein [Streptomyces sp. NPDC093970]|uniref:ATP-binding cassette domain-containing protein n=1 Tax=Streptomyces sp. NPDC093970 TaxID=3155076 RepID=UPI0034213F07